MTDLLEIFKYHKKVSEIMWGNELVGCTIQKQISIGK